MDGWVAVTHAHWFDFLARQPHREEVNFWSPSDYYAFHGLPGAPFFFKLKAPRNAIGGFGHVASFSRLPEWLAWECFGVANGAPSLETFQQRLGALRTQNGIQGRSGAPQIGCIILVQCTFFQPAAWIAQPTDWAPRNLRYQRYDLTVGEGARVWRQCQERAADLAPTTDQIPLVAAAPTSDRYGEPALVRPRLGQGAFRVAVTDAYGRACAVTGEHSLPVLEAAHIRPYAREGAHDVRNGLLLRSDVHRLFDIGYVTVTPDLHFEVSPRLRGDFENGRTYYPMHGVAVTAPANPALAPDRTQLRWHNDTIFRS